MTRSVCPNPDEIEISLFGPGKGESILIHIPGGDWILVDSCIDRATKKPAALEYFEKIGVNPSDSIKLIVASHWHDDHIRGLAQTVKASKQAELCFSSALQCNEFLQLSSTISGQAVINESSGIDEFHNSLLEIINRGKAPIFASEGSLVWKNDNCEIYALAPSNYAQLQALGSYQELLPKHLEPKKCLVPSIPTINHIAVVLLVKIQDITILLGADLEETKSPLSGWSAIVSSTTRPAQKASVFKIPHHGSQNAHSDDVWSQLLDKNALSLCTPFNGKVVLPRKSDVERIYNYTDNAHISSTIKERELSSKADTTVQKTIRESGIKMRPAPLETGHIRCRWRDSTLDVEHFNGANLLSKHLAI